MEVERTLRRVGGSVMVPIPPEMLRETGLSEGDNVRLRSTSQAIAIEPVDAPDRDLVDFARRFTARYREALTLLAQ